jgi:hypothetical protein
MAEKRVVKVMIAAPGDMDREVNDARKVIDDLNEIQNQNGGLFLEAENWADIAPESGSPQTIINERMSVERADIFIGILWRRFGSPPGTNKIDGTRYISGTEYEFDQAYASFKSNGRPLIIFYRKIDPVSTSQLSKDELKQFSNVENFFKEFGPNGQHPGLYKSFRSDEFREILRNDLLHVISEFETKASADSHNKDAAQTLSPVQENNGQDSSVSSDLFSRISPSSREAIKIAENLRVQIKNPDGNIIFTELLLAALNEKAGGPTNALLAAFGIDRSRLFAGLAAMRNWELPPNLSVEPASIGDGEIEQLTFSSNTIRAIERAGEIANEKKSRQIRSRHMLTALLGNEQYKACEWLKSMGIPVGQVRETLLQVSESQMITPAMFAYAAGVASADQTAEKDTLGFTQYAQALAEIIIKRETVPPVVFGIYGPWGSGKSTFMSFVKKYLEKWDKEHHPTKKSSQLGQWFKQLMHLQKRDDTTADQTDGAVPRIVCMRFDAWSYTDSAKLWVGLVRTISEEIDSQIRWWQRPLYWIGRGGWKFLGAILLSLLPVLAGVSLVLAEPFWKWAQNSELIRNTISILGTVVGFLGSLKLFDMQKPLSSIIESQIHRLDKTEIEGVTNRIQDELHKTVRDYFKLSEEKPMTEDKARSELKRQKKFKLVVLIDELDRCPMEKIVEILESIKLFLAEDIFIVLMAVDARVGAEAIRMHYKDVKNPDLAREYLEKIIQVPIPVPTANRTNLTTYVDSLMAIQVPQPEKKVERPKTDFQSPKPQLLPSRTALPITEEPFKPFNLEDSNTEKQAIIEFAEKYLESNPRRVKRLLNTYRYVKILATRRGTRTDTVEWQSKMIFWLGTTMRWPLFMEEALNSVNTSQVAETEFFTEVRNRVAAEYCPPNDMLVEFLLKPSELKTFNDLADNFIKENPPMAIVQGNERS